MYKNLSLALLLHTGLFAASSGIYLEAGLGTSLEDTQEIQSIEYVYDRGFSGNLALGYQADLWRFELEGLYSRDELYSFSNYKAEGDLTQNSQMLNLYYSGYNKSNFVSTIGLGAGITNISVSDFKQVGAPQDDIENNSIASFQSMGSVGYMFNEHITCSVKYRYFYTTKSDDFDAKGSSNVSLNLRYLF